MISINFHNIEIFKNKRTATYKIYLANNEHMP